MTREQVLAAFTGTPVEIDAAGVKVLARPFSTGDRLKFFDEQNMAGNGGTLYERIFVRTVCDPAGVRLFTDDDIPLVTAMNGRMVEAVAAWALEANGIREGDSGKAS